MKIAGTGFEIILAGTLSTLSAQALKVLWHALRYKALNFKVSYDTGGMPSSHSATVVTIATSVGLIEGFSSTLFAVALGLALIVMYDAAGVRRAAGHMAGILNKITLELYEHHPERLPNRLKELLGHTPVEVLAGASWGLFISWWVHFHWLD